MVMRLFFDIYNPPEPHEHGGLVLYAEYAEIEAENAKLREALAFMIEAYSNMGSVIDALKRQIDGDTSRETVPR